MQRTSTRRRTRNSFREWHLVTHRALIERPIAHSEHLRPPHQRHPNTVMFKEQGRASVVGLFFPRFPPDVARFVVPIVVDAPNRMLRRWAPTKVGKEGGVRVPPLTAHGDAAATVVAKVRGLRVVTPANHVAPNTILWRLVRLPVGRARGSLLPRQTPARQASSAKKVRAENQSFGPAVTPAQVRKAPAHVARLPANNLQSAEPCTDCDHDWELADAHAAATENA